MASIDYSQVYRQACSDASCRCNSAVLKALNAAPSETLLTLNLRNNYVGPKGFGPLLTLIDRCQSVTQIDLSGNGLDNACIDRLCEVLGGHLGVQSVNLSDNPITNDAGKPIMALLEQNTRISRIELHRVDIFAALVDRIMQAAADNADMNAPSISGGAVDLHGAAAAADSTDSRPATRSAVVDCGPPPSRGTGRNVSSKTNKDGSPTAIRISMNSSAYGTGVRSATSSSTGQVTITPKPPAPAHSANDNARLTGAQQASLRAKYKLRREQYDMADMGGASRAAAAARYQLQLLEAADERSARLLLQVEEVDQQHRSVTAGGTLDLTATQYNSILGNSSSLATRENSPPQVHAALLPAQPRSPLSTPGFNKKKRASISEVPPTEWESAEALSTEPSSRPLDVAALNNMSVDSLNNTSRTIETVGTTVSNSPHSMVIQQPTPSSTPPIRPSPRSSGPAITTNAEGQTVVHSKDPTVAPFVVPPTKEERFKALFDEGSEAYRNKDVDVAFLRWSDAAAFAQEHRNREWIAIVTNNLQRLSFEMLVVEGNQLLETGRLDEAEKKFVFATEVAKKAKNAAWEAEMAKARKNVQHAVFQKQQDRSTQLFEKAIRMPDEVLTPEDVFVSANGTKIVSHTPAFHNSWRRLLLIKEALEGWVAATEVARKITGPSSRVLLDIVSSSVLNATQYFIKLFFSEAFNTDANILPQQGTVRYRYDEAVALQELWVELVHTTVTLNCPSLQAVGKCQIGHLCLSLNMMSESVTHFKAAVAIADNSNDAALSAIGSTYLAMAHHQRSNFSEAHIAIGKALALWDTVIAHHQGTNAQLLSFDSSNGSGWKGSEADDEDPTNAPIANATTEVGKPSSPDSTTIGDSSVAIVAGLKSSMFYKYVPLEVHRHLHAHCYHLLVSILIARSSYYDALEALELSLQKKFADALSAKIKHNFAAQPTIDHIFAVAASTKSMLVYLKTTMRFEWNVEKCKYDLLEQLHSWCVPPDGELSFTTIEVTREHKAPSISHLVGLVRSALQVAPLTTRHNDGAMHLTVPNNKDKWAGPLHLLYTIIVEPLTSFIQSHNAYDPNRVLTIVPTDQLWAVPFGALLDGNNVFFIEQIALQLSFSGICSSFAALNSLQAKQRDSAKVVLVSSPAADPTDPDIGARKYGLKFPLNKERADEEDMLISEAIGSGLALDPNSNNSGPSPTDGDKHGVNGHRGEPTAPTEGVLSSNVFRNAQLTRHHKFVDDVVAAKAALPGARFIHVSAPTSSSIAIDGAAGGFCVASEYGSELSLLHNSEIGRMDLFAQLVTLSNTSVEVGLLSGVRDGTLCSLRAFLASGCPSVVGGLWCTPDMDPVELFQRLYLHHLEPQPVMLTEMKPTGPRSSVRTSSRKYGGAQGLADSRVQPSPPKGPQIIKRRNKALALALAIRDLLGAEDGEYRSEPHRWAGYFMVGVGE